MDLVGTLQSFVVVLLIVMATSRFRDRVDLMVVFTGAVASLITTIIGPPITIISTVMIAVVVAPVMMLVFVVPTTVIGLLVLAQWVLEA
jgi:hypothetical protein